MSERCSAADASELEPDTSGGTEVDQAITALEAEVRRLIWRLKRVLRERAQLVHPELGVLGLNIISTLATDGPTRASDLVERFGVDKGSISRHVQQLGEWGLIEAHPDPQDGRARVLSVTDEAANRVVAMRKSRSDRMIGLLGEWQIDDLQRLAELLGRYNVTFEEAAGEQHHRTGSATH